MNIINNLFGNMWLTNDKHDLMNNAAYRGHASDVFLNTWIRSY